MALSQAEFEALPLREQFRILAPFAESDPEVAAWCEETERALADNPLMGWEPHPARDGHQPQLEFVEALTAVVAVFAGNQFGKSTVLTVCGLREALPRELLPPLLARTKRYEGPTDGWILCPTEDKIYDSFQPAFEEWCPPAAFKGGSWGKAFNGARMLLTFKDGSTITFKTYKQDPSTLGGARLHWVGYDEPPPKAHREESRMRLVRYGGHEMFAMTPLKANTGYVRREIWKKREASHITVVRGSIHDNPHLDSGTVATTLGDLSDIWRRAREFGDFVDVGGMIYPNFERCVFDRPFERRVSRERRESQRRVRDRRGVPRPWVEAETGRMSERRGPDVARRDRRQGGPWIAGMRSFVIAIDPGIRNAAMVWVGFDRDNVAWVFAERLLQDKTPKDYARAIGEVNALWGVDPKRMSVTYVVDPAARSRGQTNAETVQQALSKEGIHAIAGQNDVETGIGQLRIRMAHKWIWVSPECRGLRDEADEYAAKEPEEGRDDSHLEPTKSNDHRLDALRYAVMERFWAPAAEMSDAQRALGWDATSGMSPPTSLVTGQRRREYGPLGSFT